MCYVVLTAVYINCTLYYYLNVTSLSEMSLDELLTSGDDISSLTTRPPCNSSTSFTRNFTCNIEDFSLRSYLLFHFKTA